MKLKTSKFMMTKLRLWYLWDDITHPMETIRWFMRTDHKNRKATVKRFIDYFHYLQCKKETKCDCRVQ